MGERGKRLRERVKKEDGKTVILGYWRTLDTVVCFLIEFVSAIHITHFSSLTRLVALLRIILRMRTHNIISTQHLNTHNQFLKDFIPENISSRL